VYPDRLAERDGAAFDPATGAWTDLSQAPVPVWGTNAAVVGGNLYVLVPASLKQHGSFVRYNPASDRWAVLPLPGTEGQLIAGSDSVFAVAGSDEQTAATDHVFHVEAGEWRRIEDDPLGPSFDREGVWFDGRLLLTAPGIAANDHTIFVWGGGEPTGPNLATGYLLRTSHSK
jgi:hypothetical protein